MILLRIFLLVVFLIGLLQNFNPVKAQDLSAIGKEKNPVKVSGGFSATNIFYGASGIKSRRDPWTYILSGSLNVDIYGLSIPLTASFSNNTGSFNQPFNQYGLSPKYKWVTGHVGYRTMNFSPYTLAGHIFLGAGVDLTPGIYRISAMYGRLNKAVGEDTLISVTGNPMYQRMGYGLKFGLTKNAHTFDVMFFKAKDDVTSISYVPEGILPAENLVIGITGRTTIIKRVSVGVDFGSSAYTRDIRGEATDYNPGNILYSTGLLTSRATSTTTKAYKTDVTYNANKYSLQLAYEWIDPGYTTMGTYFFNNDVENITVNTSTRLFKDKMNLAMNVGSQRNNLNQTQLNTMRRLIGSVNVNYNPGDRVNLNLSYSNFTNNTKINREFDPLMQLDSLDYYQVTQSANAGVSYNFGSKERKQGLSLNAAYQIAKDNLSKEISGDNLFYNANLGYRFTLVPQSLTFNIGANYNQTEMTGSSNRMIGPTAAVTKSLFKKQLRTTLASSWNNSYTESALTSRVINIRLNNTYTYKKIHNLNISMVMVNRFAKSAVTKSFSEYTGTIGYSYSF